MSSKRPLSTKVLDLFEDTPPLIRSPVPAKLVDSSKDGRTRYSDEHLTPLSQMGSVPVPPPPKPPMATPPSGRPSSRKRYEMEMKSPRRMPAGRSTELKAQKDAPGSPEKSPRKKTSRLSTNLSSGDSILRNSDHPQRNMVTTLRKVQSERNLLGTVVESSQVREIVNNMTLEDHQEYIARKMSSIVDGQGVHEQGNRDQFTVGHDFGGNGEPPSNGKKSDEKKKLARKSNSSKFLSKSEQSFGGDSETPSSIKKSDNKKTLAWISNSSDFFSKSERNVMSTPLNTISYAPEMLEYHRGARLTSMRPPLSMPRAGSERNLLALSTTASSSPSSREQGMLLSASEHTRRDRSGHSRSSSSHGAQFRTEPLKSREAERARSGSKDRQGMLLSASEHTRPDRSGHSRSLSSNGMQFKTEPLKSHEGESARSGSKDQRGAKVGSPSGRRRDSAGSRQSRLDSSFSHDPERALSSESPKPGTKRSSSKDGRGARSVSGNGRRRTSEDDRRKNPEYRSESRRERDSSKSPKPKRIGSNSEDKQRIGTSSWDERRRDSEDDRLQYRNSEYTPESKREWESSNLSEGGRTWSRSQDGQRTWSDAPNEMGQASEDHRSEYKNSQRRPERRREQESSKSPQAERSKSNPKDGQSEKSASWDEKRGESESCRQYEAFESPLESPRILESSKAFEMARIQRSPKDRRGTRSFSRGRRQRGSRSDSRGRRRDSEGGKRRYETSDSLSASKEVSDDMYRQETNESKSELRRSPKKRSSASRSPVSTRGGRSRSLSISRRRSSSRERRHRDPDRDKAGDSKPSSRASRELSSPSHHVDGSGRRARASRKSATEEVKESWKGLTKLQKKVGTEKPSDQSSISLGSTKSRDSTASQLRRGRKSDLVSNSDGSLGGKKSQGHDETTNASKVTSRSKSRDRGSRSKSGERRKSSNDDSPFHGISRRRKRALDRAAAVIQQWTRRMLEKLAIERRLVASQANLRKFRAPDYDFRMEHDKKFRVEASIAVIPIQQMIREYQARTVLRRMKHDMQRRFDTASIVIQSRIRIYLAKTIREKAKRTKEYEWQRDIERYKPEKAKYQEYVKSNRFRHEDLSRELEIVKEKLSQLERERKKVRENMLETTEMQKKVWRDLMQKQMEKEQATKAVSKKEEEDLEQEAGRDFDPNITPEELEEVNKYFTEWIELTAAKLKTKQNEGKELEKANNKVAAMFHELNDFAKKKVAEKKELSGQRLVLANMLIPKAVKNCERATAEAKVESRLKLIHRRTIYKILEGVQLSYAYDHDLYEQIKGEVQECEEQLSMKLLEGEKMKFLMLGDLDALLEIELAALHQLGDVPTGYAPE